MHGAECMVKIWSRYCDATRSYSGGGTLKRMYLLQVVQSVT